MRVPPARIHVPEEDRREILAAIDECLATGQLTLGKHGQAFEEAFAATAGTKHAIATSSGTSSLEIIFRAIGVDGGEVIVPTNTFFATPAAVMHAGGRVRFAECDPGHLRRSMSITPARSSARRRARSSSCTSAASITPRIGELRAICDAARIPLVEDAAHAHGSTFDGKPAGSFGLAASFSFYPTKVITSGEGGMIATDDDRIDAEARIYRDQGKAGFTSNFHTLLGNNWRMSEPHAVIGRTQLRAPARVHRDAPPHRGHLRPRAARHRRRAAARAGRRPRKLLQVHRDAARGRRPRGAEEGASGAIRRRPQR